MDGSADVVGEFVKGGEEAEELGEPGTNGDGEDDVPDEESDNRVLGDIALFPGDFGMEDIGYDDGDGGGNERRKPEEIIVIDDEVGEDGVETIVENGNTDTDDDVFAGTFAGLDGGGGGLSVGCCWGRSGGVGFGAGLGVTIGAGFGVDGFSFHG